MKKLFSLALLACLFVTGYAQKASDFKKYEQKIPGSEVTFEMTPVPAGTFKMGSPAGDPNKQADETPQLPILLEAFWLGTKEVTYDAYALFLNDKDLAHASEVDAVTRPTVPYIDVTSGMGKEGGFPAVGMQQYAALMYCKWLYNKTGIFYRLPSEAEWEYACRAGTQTIYPFGNDAKLLAEYAWYKDNSDHKYHKTGLKKPNAWGLYDMLGNVMEWTLDQYQEDYYATIQKDAVNPVRLPETRHPRVARGGSYMDDAAALRSANRIKSELDWNKRDPQIPKSKWWNADAPFIGFRLLRPLKQPSAAEAEKFFQSYLGL